MSLPEPNTQEAIELCKQYDLSTRADKQTIINRYDISSIDVLRHWRSKCRYAKDSVSTCAHTHTNNSDNEPDLTPDEEVSRQAQEFANKEDLKRKDERYKALLKRLSNQNILVEAIHTVAETIPPITVETTAPRYEPKGRGTETDVLQLSDVHGAEVVDPEHTMGLAQYNMEIMRRRMGMLFRKTLELVELRRSSLTINNLAVTEVGDMLSGDIHEELSRTNAMNVMMASVITAMSVSQGLAYLAPHFKRIDVYCVPGNHPRMTRKPSFKEKYVNWDYMCYQWQAVFCRDLKNVHFHIPVSPFLLANVESTRLLLLHGDSIRMWMGIPWYGIKRRAAELREMLQGGKDHYDGMLLGHFHNRGDIDTPTGPIIINGSMKGGDEFSIGSLNTYNRPSQNLLFFHNKNGYIGGGPIYLDEADNKPSMEFKANLPEVWVDFMLTGEAKLNGD